MKPEPTKGWKSPTSLHLLSEPVVHLFGVEDLEGVGDLASPEIDSDTSVVGKDWPPLQQAQGCFPLVFSPGP